MNLESLAMLQSDEFQSEVKEIINGVVGAGEKLKPEVEKLLEFFFSAITPSIVKATDQTIKEYEKLGYSRKEAIILTCSLKDNLNKLQTRVKS